LCCGKLLIEKTVFLRCRGDQVNEVQMIPVTCITVLLKLEIARRRLDFNALPFDLSKIWNSAFGWRRKCMGSISFPLYEFLALRRGFGYSGGSAV
jgi:hypothetical protein